MDFVRTIGNPQCSHARVGLGQAEIGGHPGPAVGLDGVIDDRQSHERRLHLDHRDFRARNLVSDGVHHVGRLQREKACTLDIDPGIGDPLLPN